jgi:hypothetical protein
VRRRNGGGVALLKRYARGGGLGRCRVEEEARFGGGVGLLARGKGRDGECELWMME